MLIRNGKALLVYLSFSLCSLCLFEQFTAGFGYKQKATTVTSTNKHFASPVLLLLK